MHPASLFLALKDAGITARVVAGKLKAAPISLLVGDLRELVLTHKDALVAWLEEPGPADADLDAIAMFCADQDDDEPVTLRRCVLLRWPCGTVLALSQEALDAWPRGSKPAGTEAKQKAARPKSAAKEDLF
jgi:hypothetical protein